jgi:hypothetical protein
MVQIAPPLLIRAAVRRIYGDHNVSRITTSAVLLFREKEEFDDPFRPRGGDCIYVRGTSISCSIDRIIDLGGVPPATTHHPDMVVTDSDASSTSRMTSVRKHQYVASIY